MDHGEHGFCACAGGELRFHPRTLFIWACHHGNPLLAQHPFLFGIKSIWWDKQDVVTRTRSSLENASPSGVKTFCSKPSAGFYYKLIRVQLSFLPYLKWIRQLIAEVIFLVSLFYKHIFIHTLKIFFTERESVDEIRQRIHSLRQLVEDEVVTAKIEEDDNDGKNKKASMDTGSLLSFTFG